MDGNLIDSPKASRSVKDDIEVLLNKNVTSEAEHTSTPAMLNDLETLIRPALQSSLDAGTAKVAVMHIGARQWKLTELTD